MAFSAGTRLGPYDITAQIGAGGMGEVYRATDTNLKRAVAIKVLPASVAADAERLARFQREAEVLAALNHPNIAQIYGLERSGGTTALVMELVEGPTLADRIAQGAVPMVEARTIAVQLAEALEYAHEHGIIHRDLKPANIKVTPDGAVKVLDFGLAKALAPDLSASAPDLMAVNSPTITSPAMTMRGMILGTAAYMSPEQARGTPADKRSDIWAFGVVLYEMLTGGRCFDGPSITDVLAAVVKTEPDWGLLPPDIPPNVRSILRRCLRKDVRSRLRDIGDARIELLESESASETLTPDRIDAHGAGRLTTWRDRLSWFAPWAVALLALATAAASLLSPSGTEQVSITRRFDLMLPDTGPLEFVGEANTGSGHTALALSHDGTMLAYVGTSGETTRLLLYDLRSGTVKPLENTAGAYHPFFSPTGEWVAFFAANQLKKVSVTTGEVVTITKAPNPYGGAWGENDIIVVNVKDNAETVVVSADGTAHSLPVPAGARIDIGGRYGGPFFPSFLPGLEWVIGQGCTGFTVLCARSVRTGEIQVLTTTGPVPIDEAGSSGLAGTSPRYVGSGHLLYARAADGVLVALPFDPKTLAPLGTEVPLVSGIRREGSLTGALQLTVGHDGTAIWAAGTDARTGQFVWVDSAGRREPLPIPAGAYGDFELSPSRRWLATIVTGVTGRSEIRFFDLQRQGLSYQWSDSTFAPRWLVWSPDEESVIAIGRDGNRRVRRDGTGLTTEIGKGVWPDQILTDSTIVARVLHEPKNGGMLWTLTLGNLLPDGGLPTPAVLLKKPIIADYPNPTFASLSPDRKWLTFTSNPTGLHEVYVVPDPFTGPATRVSTDGGELGLWSPDGRLYYRIGRRWYVVAPTGNTSEPFTTPRFFIRGNFENVAGVDYAVSADSRRLLVLQGPADEKAGSLHVITNWFDELRRLAPPKK